MFFAVPVCIGFSSDLCSIDVPNDFLSIDLTSVDVVTLAIAEVFALDTTQSRLLAAKTKCGRSRRRSSLERDGKQILSRNDRGL